MSDGWVIAGTFAQFAALLALAAVWLQLADRRRKMRPVFLRFDVVGRRQEEGVAVGHLAEIGNSGSGIALIQQVVLVNAEWQLSDDYRPRTALGSGEGLWAGRLCMSAYLSTTFESEAKATGEIEATVFWF